MQRVQKVTPFLWFDSQAEEAAALYVSIFPNARVVQTTRVPDAPGQPGRAMTVVFELDGVRFIALNGGPHFKFNEAVSFLVRCATQAEVDDYWEKLGAGGDESARRCGWLKDKFGVSWQIVPDRLMELLADPDPAKAARTTQAMLQMSKLDIAELERAHGGA